MLAHSAAASPDCSTWNTGRLRRRGQNVVGQGGVRIGNGPSCRRHLFARSLARMFHVEHLTCLRNLVVANPTSAFVAAPCPPYSAGASPDCSSGGALGKKQGTDEISLVSVPSFGTDTYRRHLFAREPCSNVPRETRHAWTCRTKCRTCESGPHSHLALWPLHTTLGGRLARMFHVEHVTRPRTKPRNGESEAHSFVPHSTSRCPGGRPLECFTWNVLASTGSVGTAWLRDQTPGAS